jgi:HEAT repeat protein
VSAAASSLARLDDRESVPALRAALGRATHPESKRDLGRALCELGAEDGAQALLNGLSQQDDLTRTWFFEAFFAVTGMHAGYDPGLSHGDRLESLAHLRGAWEAEGGKKVLRHPPEPRRAAAARAATLVDMLGGGSDVSSGGDDAAMMDELVALGEDAVPALVEGLTYPYGWTVKRERVCETLGRIASKEAAPALVSALRDPYVAVSDWACLALEKIGDPEALPALVRFEARVVGLQQNPTLTADSEWLLARVARTRWMLGDESARSAIISLLLSSHAPARQLAIATLEERHGERRGYDADAPPAERLEAAKRWAK